MDAINFWLGIRRRRSHQSLDTQIGKVEPQYRKFELNVRHTRTLRVLGELGEIGFIQMFQRL